MAPSYTTARLLLAAFFLYCVPVIHAVALLPVAKTYHGSSGIAAQEVRSWLRSVTDIGLEVRGDTANATPAIAYLRVASLSIALYDFLMTVTGEFRLYASQPSLLNMSRACALFIAVRYTSIAAMIASNAGFFGTGFSASVCEHYHLLAPLLKVFAVMFSQLIVSLRTYAIARKEPTVRYILCVLFIICMIPEFLGNTWGRVLVQDDGRNCQSGNNDIRISWVHYLAAMTFDAVAMGISTRYLTVHTSTLSLMSGLSRLMLKEGMIYFFSLTAVNILNLAFYLYGSIAAQSCAASLGIAVTMIMSQRIVLSVHDWRPLSALMTYSSHHEMPLVGLPGSDGGNAGAGRLHNFGTNPASHSFTPSASGALKFTNGTPGTFAFDENRNRRLPIHSVLVPQRSVAREYVCPGKGSSEQVPMEIRVEVHEETKKDYDSMYTASVLQTVESNIESKLEYSD